MKPLDLTPVFCYGLFRYLLLNVRATLSVQFAAGTFGTVPPVKVRIHISGGREEFDWQRSNYLLTVRRALALVGGIFCKRFTGPRESPPRNMLIIKTQHKQLRLYFSTLYFVVLSGASSLRVALERKYYLTAQKSQLGLPCHTRSVCQSLLTLPGPPTFIPQIINPHVITDVSRLFAISDEVGRLAVIIGTAGLRLCGARPPSFLLLLLPVALKQRLQHVGRAFSHEHRKEASSRLYNEIILFWPSSSKVLIKGFCFIFCHLSPRSHAINLFSLLLDFFCGLLLIAADANARLPTRFAKRTMKIVGGGLERAEA